MRKFSHLFSILTRLISFKMCLLTLSSRNIYNNRSRNESTFSSWHFLAGTFRVWSVKWSDHFPLKFHFTARLEETIQIENWIGIQKLRGIAAIKVCSCHFFLQNRLNGKNRWQKIIFQKCHSTFGANCEELLLTYLSALIGNCPL